MVMVSVPMSSLMVTLFDICKILLNLIGFMQYFMDDFGDILYNGVVSLVQRSVQLNHMLSNIVDASKEVYHILLELFLNLL